MSELERIEHFLDNWRCCNVYHKQGSADERVDFLIKTSKADFTLHYKDRLVTLGFPISYFSDDVLTMVNSWNIEYGSFSNLSFEKEDQSLFLSHLIFARNCCFIDALEYEINIFLERILELKKLIGVTLDE